MRELNTHTSLSHDTYIQNTICTLDEYIRLAGIPYSSDSSEHFQPPQKNPQSILFNYKSNRNAIYCPILHHFPPDPKLVVVLPVLVESLVQFLRISNVSAFLNALPFFKPHLLTFGRFTFGIMTACSADGAFLGSLEKSAFG